jgi:hypothetical protein
VRIEGHRGKPKKIKAEEALRKHIKGLRLLEAQRMIDDVCEGIPVVLETDLVLAEELEEAGFIVT